MSLSYLRNNNHSKSVMRSGLTVGLACCFSVAPQALPMAAVPTGNFRGMSYAMAVDSAMDEEFSEVEVRETVRKYFPETWIWDMVPLE